MIRTLAAPVGDSANCSERSTVDGLCRVACSIVGDNLRRPRFVPAQTAAVILVASSRSRCSVSEPFGAVYVQNRWSGAFGTVERLERHHQLADLPVRYPFDAVAAFEYVLGVPEPPELPAHVPQLAHHLVRPALVGKLADLGTQRGHRSAAICSQSGYISRASGCRNTSRAAFEALLDPERN